MGFYFFFRCLTADHCFFINLCSNLLLLWVCWQLAFCFYYLNQSHSVKTFYKWSLSAWNCSAICLAVLLFMIHPFLHISVPLEGVCGTAHWIWLLWWKAVVCAQCVSVNTCQSSPSVPYSPGSDIAESFVCISTQYNIHEISKVKVISVRGF